MWQLLINEWRYVHFKGMILFLFFITLWFVNYGEFDETLGQISALGIIFEIIKPLNKIKETFYYKLPISVSSIAIMRLINMLIFSFYCLFISVIIFLIIPETISIDKTLFMIVLYPNVGIIWLIIDDLIKIIKYRWIISRLILLVSLVIGVTLVLNSHVKISFDQGMMFLVIIMLLLSFISVKTYKRRMSYLP